MAKIKQMEKKVNKNVHTEQKVAKTTETKVPKQKPVFEEIKGMDQTTAISVLIQAAEMAQKAGALSMRDAVVLAKAIDTIVPGKL